MSGGRFLRLRITEPAELDLEGIWGWIHTESGTAAADRLIEEVLAACRRLVAFPMMGKVYPDLGPTVRGWVVRRHVVLYRVIDDDVLVLRVIHGARDIPEAWRERDPDV